MTVMCSRWYFLLPIILAAVFYFAFIAYLLVYLLVYLLICIGFTSIASYPFVKKYYRYICEFDLYHISTIPAQG